MQAQSLSQVVYLIVVILAYSVITEALTGIIKNAAPLEGIRQFFSRRSTFISDLLSCGYCCSVWTGVMLIGSFMPSIVPDKSGFLLVQFAHDHLYWFFNGLLIHRLSNIIHDRIKLPEYVVIPNEDIK